MTKTEKVTMMVQFSEGHGVMERIICFKDLEVIDKETHTPKIYRAICEIPKSQVNTRSLLKAINESLNEDIEEFKEEYYNG